MILPAIDPVALQIGPLAIRWYSLTWMAAFIGIYSVAKYRLKIFSTEQLGDLMFYGLLGAMLGGRTGYCFFYGIDQLTEDPLWLFRVWEGGLSFHGGLLGVLIAVYFLSRSWGVRGCFDMNTVGSWSGPFGGGYLRNGEISLWPWSLWALRVFLISLCAQILSGSVANSTGSGSALPTRYCHSRIRDALEVQ